MGLGKNNLLESDAANISSFVICSDLYKDPDIGFSPELDYFPDQMLGMFEEGSAKHESLKLMITKFEIKYRDTDTKLTTEVFYKFF